jgi:Domain of unknown function (DUF4350)
MKDRLLTFALALAAFALFYTLLMPKPQGPKEHVTRPITTEKGPNGYLAMARWLEAEGVKTVSLRERYGRLRELPGTAATGNLMISTTPHLYPLRDSEVGPLRDWISAGNTLLVVAGLSDTPDWSMGEGVDVAFMDHMNSMTGLDFVRALSAQEKAQEEKAKQEKAGEGKKNDDAHVTPAAPQSKQPSIDVQQVNAANGDRKLDQPLQFEAVPNGPHPLLEGVKSISALSEYPTLEWQAVSHVDDLILELTRNSKSEEPTLWLLRHGKGQVIVSAYGSVFTNKLLGKADNGRLLANIVKWSRQPGAAVIIDDAHQGLVAFYDAQAFFHDPRLHRTLWWLVALWLAFVLGPQRLRAAASGWNPVDVTSFVRASGGFMARVLRPSVVGQQLFANFFNDVRRRVGLPIDGAPVWDWMNANRALPGPQMDELRELHDKAMRGRRIDLPILQTLLVQARGTLL